MSEQTKICAKCEKELPLSEFDFRKDTHKYRTSCSNCETERRTVYRENNKEIIKLRKKKYWEANKDRLRGVNIEKAREYRANNLEKRRKSARDWAKRNKNKQLEYVNNKYNTDPQFNIAIKHRRRIGMALKRIGGGRKDRIIDLLGCNYEFFKVHIEKQFKEGMAWDMVLNGSIHLDHIKPCSKFNLLNHEEQKICFHYSNYQPLWAQDNLEKHNKYEQYA